MKMKMLKLALVLMTGSLLGGTPSVSMVSVQQRWPWNALVDIDYTLDGDDDEVFDIDVVLYTGETRLSVSRSAFYGDVQNVARGRRRITFDPVASGLPAGTYSSVRAELTARPAALYLIVDLTKSKGAADVVTYLTAKELSSGNYGPVVTNPVAGVNSVAWTGVTNDEAYATTKYVMRRITAGTFMMGANNKVYNKDYAVRTNCVTISRDFYIGVFETTQRQWELVMGSNPSYFKTNGATRPVEGITYADVRGESASWPADGYGQADQGSFLYKLCDLTGLTFDLPTFAQWQYASGASLSTWFNTGRSPASSAYWEASPEADECARYNNTAGTAVPTSGTIDYSQYDVDQATAKVGSYRCNSYGLYDMHGNVWEFLLDYSNGEYDYPEVCVDPVGSPTGTNRMWGGASFRLDARYIRLGFRGLYDIPLKSTKALYKRESGFRAIVMP